MQSYLNLDHLTDRLKTSEIKLNSTIERLDLPQVPSMLVEQVENADIPENLQRLILALLKQQGSRSDVLSATCAIGNISDTWSKPKRLILLDLLNLKISCKLFKACNRFGSLTTMGHLFIEPTVKNEHWQPRQAANDSIRLEG